MPRFSQFLYNTATYGVKSALPFSADPMTAVAVLYDAVALDFASPTGSYVEFRIVRNQENYPQSQEDGAIILASMGKPSTTSILDGKYTDKGTVESFSALPSASINQLYTVKSSGNSTGQAYVWNGVEWRTPSPLVSGRFVYYRAWIRASSDSDWVQAGTTFTLIPKINSLSLGRDTVYTSSEIPTRDRLVYTLNNGDSQLSTTHERFMSTIPAVFVSETNSSFDVTNDVYDPAVDSTGVETNSLISTFLSAFSYTVDEFITWARGIYPDNQNHRAGEASIIFKSHELGVKPDYEGVTLTQKKLLSNAVEIYGSKGTKNGLQLFVESATGYSSTISETRNLLLTHEESNFDIAGWTSGAVGNWSAVSSNPVLSVDNSQTPYSEADSLDNDFSLKVVTNGTNEYITLGALNSVGAGIPVVAGEVYSLSFYAQQASSAKATPEVRWYDRAGVLLSTTTGTATDTATTFTRISMANKTAPAGAVYAALAIKFAANSTYYIDMVQFEQSATVTAYQEPRGAVITLEPTKTNLILNPSFEITDFSAWSGTALDFARVSTETEPSCYGDYHASLTATSSAVIKAQTSAYITVTAGKKYSASAYMKDKTTAKKYVAGIIFYNSSNAAISGGEFVGPETTLTTSTWSRVSVSGLAPATATKAKVYFKSAEAVTSGSVVYLDSAQFEQNEIPTDYFDGSLTGRGGAWAGTANESVSYYYLALSNRVSRLQQEITDYLGINTPYYIKFSGTPTTTGSLSGIA